MDPATLLAAYYACVALANEGALSQAQRFACNDTYQSAKRMFLPEDASPGAILTPGQNVRAYLRFKRWETENPDIVRALQPR